jgi:hypothetical protein
MPRQRQIHCPFHIEHAARIKTHDEGRHCLNPRPNAGAVRGHISVPPRGAFAPACHACIRFDLDQCRIELFELETATGEPIGML